MKKFTLAATLLAVTASFTAPSFAMDNPAGKSRVKIEQALGQHDAYAPKSQTRATTYTDKNRQLDRHERAHKRLFNGRKSGGPVNR